MITINSLSGGMTSATIASMYKADYNLFALVTSTDKLVMFPDKGIRKIVSDKIGREFIGTLEDDLIIYTMLDLEQYLGTPITWVAGIPFDELIKRGGGYNRSFKKNVYLPNMVKRYCTTHMKLEPMFNWWHRYISEPIEMRIGFRANESHRIKRMVSQMDNNGLVSFDYSIMCGVENKRNKWVKMPWQKPVFPLFDNQMYKQDVLNYWDGKPVRFAPLNNCVGCFHRNPILLKKISDAHPNKFDWFIKQETKTKSQFKSELTYQEIKNHKLQIEIPFSAFGDDNCDAGYCGL